MSFSRDFSWYTQGVGDNGHSLITGGFQRVKDPFECPSQSPISWEDDFQSIDPISFSSSAQPSPKLLGSELTVPPSAHDQAGRQPLSPLWIREHCDFTAGYTAPFLSTVTRPTHELPLDYNPSEDKAKTGLQTIDHDYHTAINATSRRFNINPSDQEVYVHMHMTEPYLAIRRQTACQRATNTRSTT